MDLTERLGFKSDLDLGTGEIHFEGLRPTLVLERRLSDMQPVLAEPQERDDDPIVHRIYRMIGDTPEIVASGLKFDITVILPGQFGREFPKTTGHYHLPLQNSVPTPDFYQIIYGQGLIMTQTENGLDVNAFVIEASEMHHVLIPPAMGHLTINTGEEPLVFANICVRAEHLNYQPYIDRRGGAYYLLRTTEGIQFHQNKNYNDPTLDKLKPNKLPGLEDLERFPFYDLLKKQTPRLKFLAQPQEHTALFNIGLTKKTNQA